MFLIMGDAGFISSAVFEGLLPGFMCLVAGFQKRAVSSLKRVRKAKHIYIYIGGLKERVVQDAIISSSAI